MSLTTSTMLPLQIAAPEFELPDVVSGERVSLSNFDKCRGFVVMFLCVHCPFVKHVERAIVKVAQDYQKYDFGFVAISSNSLQTHPQDGPQFLKAQAQELGFTFPYCFDETQAVAKAYRAACTPDFFVFSRDRALVYRGQFDDSRPSNGKPVTGQDLRQALEAMLLDLPIDPNQKPSIGCNIKWTPGNEPDYLC
jgi:peroxiredoxin